MYVKSSPPPQDAVVQRHETQTLWSLAKYSRNELFCHPYLIPGADITYNDEQLFVNGQLWVND